MIDYKTKIDLCKIALTRHGIMNDPKARRLIKVLDSLVIDGDLGLSSKSFCSCYTNALTDMIIEKLAVNEEGELVFKTEDEHAVRWNVIQNVENAPVAGGRYGIAGKDFIPEFSDFCRSFLSDNAVRRGIKFRFSDSDVCFVREDDEVVEKKSDDKFELEVKINESKEAFEARLKDVDLAYSSWCLEGLDNLKLAMADAWLKELYGLDNRMYVFLGQARTGKTSWMRTLTDAVGRPGQFKMSLDTFCGDKTAESRKTVYDAMTKKAGFLDEYKGWNAQTRKSWGSLMGLVTGESQFCGRLPYQDSIDKQISSSFYCFSNFSFMDSFEDYDLRRLAVIKLQRSDEAEKILKKVRKEVGPWAELYLSCKAWTSPDISQEEVFSDIFPEYSREEVLLVNWLLKHDWYWPSKNNKLEEQTIFIENEMNEAVLPLTSIKQVNWKKLGLEYKAKRIEIRKSKDSDEMIKTVKKCFVVNDGSKMWKKTLTDLLNECELEVEDKIVHDRLKSLRLIQNDLK